MMVVEGIAKAEENGTSLNKTLDDLGVSELRQVDTLSRLVNANKDYADNIKRADIAYEKGSALSEEAAERYKTVKSQIKILVNNFKEFAITIGDIFLPIVRKVIDFFEKMTEWLNNLEPGTKEMIANAIMFVAVLSPLLTVISKMTGSFKVIMDFIPKIKAALALLMPILQSVATMVAGLFSKIAMFATMHPIIAIIIALGAAFIALYNNCEPFREMVQKIITKIKELWDKFKEVNWIEHLGEKFGWLGEIIGGVLEFIKGVVDWITRLIEKVKEFLGLSGEVSSSAASASNIISGRGGSYRSDGFGSGGFNSGGITLNPVFNVSTNNVTRADVRAWSQWMLDDINDGLGRAI
jgi:phage-related minor tail protein